MELIQAWNVVGLNLGGKVDSGCEPMLMGWCSGNIAAPREGEVIITENRLVKHRHNVVIKSECIVAECINVCSGARG